MGGYRRFCVECGSELKPGARFCANCGHAAANDPQPAATGEHEAATRDLAVPPPSHAWDASAAPPEGGLVPPPGSALAPQGAAFPPDEPRFPPAGSRFPPPDTRYQAQNVPHPAPDAPFPPPDIPYPPAMAPGRPQDVPYPPATVPGRPQDVPYPPAASPARPQDGPRPPAGLPGPPRDVPYPPAISPARPQDGPRPPAGPSGTPGTPGSFGFPGGDMPPGTREAGFPPPGTTATSTGLALPPARPAPTVTAQLPAGPPPAGPAPGEAVIPAANTGTAQFSRTWVDDVGFSPRWEPTPADAARPPAGTRERPRRLLAVGLFGLVAAVIVVPALLIAHSFHSITGGAAAAAKPTAKEPGGGSTAAAPTQRAAAAGLATLLAQTAADRSSIVNAVGAVEHCTAALAQAPQVFQNSAASRQRLLQQLAALPGRSALPAPMIQELTGAWQASAAVDTDLGKWAQDEATRGCRPNDHADANYQASGPPDVQATNDKTAFVSTWNAIAAKYSLTRYQTSQL